MEDGAPDCSSRGSAAGSPKCQHRQSIWGRGIGIIHGLAGSPIQGVVFKDCKIAATKGPKLDHARKVDLTGLSLDVREGEAITKVDVE